MLAEERVSIRMVEKQGTAAPGNRSVRSKPASTNWLGDRVELASVLLTVAQLGVTVPVFTVAQRSSPGGAIAHPAPSVMRSNCGVPPMLPPAPTHSKAWMWVFAG